MNDNQRKAMWARIHSDNSREHLELKDMMKQADAKRLQQPYGAYLSRHLFYDNERLENFRGHDRDLTSAISSADYISPDKTWSFHNESIHPTLRGVDIYDTFPLENRGITKLVNYNGVTEDLPVPWQQYFVNDTMLDEKILSDIAKYAKKKKLLETGTIEELQMKGRFEATTDGSNKPVSIKLHNNTFLLAPFVTGIRVLKYK